MKCTLLLAIDTCTRIASVALAGDDKVWAELTWAADQNHTAQLAPRIQYLLSQSSLEPLDLGAVAVAIGPGSFNGVRAGMSLAKALTFALRIPLVGVSALEAQAYPHAPTGFPICAIQDAGRGELAVGLYRHFYRRWRQLRPEGIISWEELPKLIRRPTIVCGDLYPNLASEVRRRLKEKAILAPPSASPRRAGYVAELGWRRLKEGHLLHPSLIQPLYLRSPAVTQRRKP